MRIPRALPALALKYYAKKKRFVVSLDKYFRLMKTFEVTYTIPVKNYKTGISVDFVLLGQDKDKYVYRGLHNNVPYEMYIYRQSKEQRNSVFI
jgi:hypothetical protein